MRQVDEPLESRLLLSPFGDPRGDPRRAKRDECGNHERQEPGEGGARRIGDRPIRLIGTAIGVSVPPSTRMSPWMVSPGFGTRSAARHHRAGCHWRQPSRAAGPRSASPACPQSRIARRRGRTDVTATSETTAALALTWKAVQISALTGPLRQRSETERRHDVEVRRVATRRWPPAQRAHRVGRRWPPAGTSAWRRRRRHWGPNGDLVADRMFMCAEAAGGLRGSCGLSSAMSARTSGRGRAVVTHRISSCRWKKSSWWSARACGEQIDVPIEADVRGSFVQDCGCAAIPGACRCTRTHGARYLRRAAAPTARVGARPPPPGVRVCRGRSGYLSYPVRSFAILDVRRAEPPWRSR